MSRQKPQDNVWWKISFSEKSADDMIAEMEEQKRKQQINKLENEWINKSKSLVDGFHEVPNPNMDSPIVSAMDILKGESEGKFRYFLCFKPSAIEGYKEYDELLEVDALKLAEYLKKQPKIA